MTTYIIYHNADNDGMASAWIARERLVAEGNAVVLIGYQYGDPLNEIDAIPDGSWVYMLDVSLKAAEMVALAARTNLTWVDHHERENKEIAPLLEPYATQVVYGTKSACRLTWAYFNPVSNEPKWVNLVGRYDVFDKADMNLWEFEILPFEYALRAFVNGVDSFTVVHDTAYSVNEWLRDGRNICEYLQRQANKRIEYAHKTLFLGLPALVISGETGDFWYNTPRYKKEKPTLLVFPRYDFAKRSWKVSLRQGADEEPCDCAELASRYGGGGHLNAAGFTVKEWHF
jgi:uncharacterized protein